MDQIADDVGRLDQRAGREVGVTINSSGTNVNFTLTINTGDGDDIIEINDLAVDALDNVTIIGGDGNDTLIITGTNDLSGSTIDPSVEQVLIRSDVTFTAEQIQAVGGNIAVHPDQFDGNGNALDPAKSHAISLVPSGGVTSVSLTNLNGVTSMNVEGALSVEIDDTGAAALKGAGAGITFTDATATIVVSKAAKADLDLLTIQLDTGAGPVPYDLPYTILRVLRKPNLMA